MAVAPTPSTAPARAGIVLISLIAVAAVANLNLSVANVALPSIGEAFDSSQVTLNLIAVGYSLGLAASVLYFGAIGDRYGRKLMLILGTALAIPMSLLAAYAPSDEVLFAARVGGGLAAGMAYPTTLAITSAAKESFLEGDDWAYAAGLGAVVLGAVLVFTMFPRHDDEVRLLAEYHATDAAAVAVSQPAQPLDAV